LAERGGMIMWEVVTYVTRLCRPAESPSSTYGPAASTALTASSPRQPSPMPARRPRWSGCADCSRGVTGQAEARGARGRRTRRCGVPTRLGRLPLLVAGRTGRARPCSLPAESPLPAAVMAGMTSWRCGSVNRWSEGQDPVL
jgi:hypothetical protein